MYNKPVFVELSNEVIVNLNHISLVQKCGADYWLYITDIATPFICLSKEDYMTLREAMLTND